MRCDYVPNLKAFKDGVDQGYKIWESSLTN